MTERIHDDEPDTSEPIVRALLAAECPQWARSPLKYLQTSGTDNAMWRVFLEGEPDVVLRLPRRPLAADGVRHEVAVLQQLESVTVGSGVATPRVRHVGHPHEVFPHPWSVLEWIDGADAWTGRSTLDMFSLDELARDLADSITTMRGISRHALRPRTPGSRGGPLGPLLEQLDRWLASPGAASLFDVAAVKRLAAEAREVADEPVPEMFVHGDLIPGNLLVSGGRLTAIIDWGGAGSGDPAQDLAPAWSVLTAAERPTFKDAVEADDAAWIRGRTFELEHAVGGVLYYAPKRHVLGDVMARTLGRILTDS